MPGPPLPSTAYTLAARTARAARLFASRPAQALSLETTSATYPAQLSGLTRLSRLTRTLTPPLPEALGALPPSLVELHLTSLGPASGFGSALAGALRGVRRLAALSLSFATLEDGDLVQLAGVAPRLVRLELSNSRCVPRVQQSVAGCTTRVRPLRRP